MFLNKQRRNPLRNSGQSLQTAAAAAAAAAAAVLGGVGGLPAEHIGTASTFDFVP
jgi:hypothetical protein